MLVVVAAVLQVVFLITRIIYFCMPGVCSCYLKCNTWNIEECKC